MTWLDDLERLEREATPAPWDAVQLYGHSDRAFLNQHGKTESIFAMETLNLVGGHAKEADADLLAALRNNTPRLLAIARAAEALLAAMEHVEMESRIESFQPLHIATAARDALRKALEGSL